jgi:hypothetical protein
MQTEISYVHHIVAVFVRNIVIITFNATYFSGVLLHEGFRTVAVGRVNFLCDGEDVLQHPFFLIVFINNESLCASADVTLRCKHLTCSEI